VLDRALVKADDGALGIGSFGTEIKHILHPGDVVRVDLGNASHVLAPRLEMVLCQAPTHRLGRQGSRAP
jgi:hypothetical protein